MMLSTWAQRVLRTVEADGQAVARIKLTTHDGTVWNTWDAPFAEPDVWCEEATAVIDELSTEWPKRRIQLVFVAEDKAGTIMAQQLKSVVGRNPAGADTFGPENPKALAEAMGTLAGTFERTLTTVNAQVAIQHKTIELLGQRLHDSFDYIEAMREAHALQEDDLGERVVKVLETAAEHLPGLASQILELREAKRRKDAERAQLKEKTNGALPHSAKE